MNRFFGQILSTNPLNYIPGLVILIFGMLAVHSSVRLFEMQEFLFGIHDIDSQELRVRQTWLYWSVIAIGLSGFVLVVLNSDKLLKLKKINEEKKEALQLLENRLAAMEATLDGIGIVDKEGILTYMNKALQDLHGIAPDDVGDYIGHSWQRLYNEKGRDQIVDNVLPLLEDRSFWRGRSPILRKDGTVIQADLSLTRLPDGGFIGTARDVTMQEEADREKEDLQKQFYQAQKMEAIGRLAGGIAHDFNNILAAMNGYAEFLIDDLEEDTPQHKFAANILQAGQQARSLVDQILAFSRRKDAEAIGMNLTRPVRESLSMLEASLPKTIEVETDIQLEDAHITGNATQISQVIMNLCVNAKDAMEDDKGVLEISLKAVDASVYEQFDIVKGDLPETGGVPLVRIEDVSPGRTRLFMGHLSGEHGQYVCLKIGDSGSGMDRSILEHIFEPFFTTKPVEQGTGLGLATVHGVVAAHRGAMIIDSTMGEGTSFEIFLPLLREEESAEASGLPETQSGERGSGRVLLVEDQQHVGDMMVNMLVRLGYEADHRTTGLEALDTLRENPGTYDLVITDQNMPKMTGLELVMQAHFDFPDLPFILLSGYSQEKLQDLMKEHPAIKAILRKPVEKAVLGRKIKEVLAWQEKKNLKCA